MTSAIEELSGEQRKTLADYWWLRAEGESTSWVAFQQVRIDLEDLGAPISVLELADQAVEDEHRHALWCRDWAVRFGHSGGNPEPRTREALTFRGALDSEQGMLRVLLCCFTETTGCVLLDLVRDSVTDPELREQNHQHLKDELRHSRVGWAQLAALTEKQRGVVLKWAPALIAELEGILARGESAERMDLQPFGYFPMSLQMEAVRQAIEGVIIPGLSHHGLWRKA